MCYGKIAVIMTAYNEKKEWLSEAIESVLSQTYENIHLYLLLDNPDNSDLDELIVEFEKRDSRVSYLKNEKNIGLVRSLNKLLTIVTEDYVARMDADDICVNTRIEEEMKFLQENSLDFVMSGFDFIRNDVLQEGPKVPLLLSESFAECQKYGNYSAHPTWLLKRDVYESLNGYRNVATCEDLEFVLRAIQAGYKVGRTDKVLLHYRLRESGISGSNAYEQYTKSCFLHKMYAKGKAISNIDIKELNKMGSNFGEIEGRRFVDAKKRIEGLAGSLYRHEYVACVINVLQNYLSSTEYRHLFWDYFINSRKVAKVLKKNRNCDE